MARTGLSGAWAAWAAPLVGALALLGGPAPVQAQNNWMSCASEGGVCRFNGEGMVRFGADGRYAFRVANGRVDCNTRSFGDPAPGLRKSCEVQVSWRGSSQYRGWGRHGQSNGGWRYCAEENQECETHGPATVRFGADGRWETRSVNGRVFCGTRVFGDPLPNVPKVCEVRESTDWTVCAYEGSTCRVPGQATVRYGSGGRYAQRVVNGAIACDNRAFGDPAPGQAKMCEYSRNGAGASGGWNSSPSGGGSGGGGAYGQRMGEPGYIERATGPDDGGQWMHCADEGGYCAFQGFATVRYGVAGRYVYRDMAQGARCENGMFGEDPAPDVRKHCQVRRR